MSFNTLMAAAGGAAAFSVLMPRLCTHLFEIRISSNEQYILGLFGGLASAMAIHHTWAAQKIIVVSAAVSFVVTLLEHKRSDTLVDSKRDNTA